MGSQASIPIGADLSGISVVADDGRGKAQGRAEPAMARRHVLRAKAC